MRNDFDLPVSDLVDRHLVSQIADAAIDLDLVVQELFEGGDVEDFVRGGLGGVDYELWSVSHQLVQFALMGGSSAHRIQ